MTGHGAIEIRGWSSRILPGLIVLLATLFAGPPADAAEFHFGAVKSQISSTSDGTSKNSHHVIDIAGASVTCTTGGFTGSAAVLSASQIKLAPQYSLCTFAGTSATVLMNSCAFQFNANGELSIVDSAAITCSKDPMTISVLNPPCSVTIGAQTLSNAVNYTNIQPGFTEEITLDFHATGIAYTATGSGCPETGIKTNGNYTTGNTILTTETIGFGMTDFWWG